MHPEPELLALLALGEDIGVDARQHVEHCTTCLAEVAELAQLVGIGRTSGGSPELVAPPARVWDATAAELGLSITPPVEPPPALVPTPAATPPTPSAAPAPRRRRWVAVVLAAVLALVVGFGLGTVIRLPDRVDTIAQTQLTAMPSWPASSGSATVEQGADGHRTLVISLTTPQPVQGSREVWLISSDLKALRSLGYLNGSTGRFTIPDGLDLARYPIVDVSREAYDDADPAHSGNSIVRGQLAF